jgi:geranylgeranyl reductase family protein
MRDVLVVGGGPVGGQTARHLAAKGHDVLLVEEHPRVGEPVQCAGLFTPRIFDLVDFPLSNVHLNDVRGANVHGPGGHTVTLDGGKTMAVAIDRGAFDRECVESARRAGAEIRTRVKAVAARREAGRVVVTLRDADGHLTEEPTRLLVGADGVQSQVAKWFGLPRAREIIPCYGAQVEGTKLTPTHVEMWVGRERAPGFFSWMIPTNPEGTAGKVEVGVDVKAPNPARFYYERMWKDPASAKFLRDDAYSCFDICACIPLGPIKATSGANVALVGDAAAQTKPTSGGGVYTGLVCAGHLADVADEALRANDLSQKRLAQYHDRWYDDIGRELYVGWRLRKAFMHLRDDQMEDLFHTLDDPEMLGMVNLLGDIDYPSRLARPLMKKAPQLFRYSVPFVKSLFD